MGIDKIKRNWENKNMQNYRVNNSDRKTPIATDNTINTNGKLITFWKAAIKNDNEKKKTMKKARKFDHLLKIKKKIKKKPHSTMIIIILPTSSNGY